MKKCFSGYDVDTDITIPTTNKTDRCNNLKNAVLPPTRAQRPRRLVAPKASAFRSGAEKTETSSRFEPPVESLGLALVSCLCVVDVVQLHDNDSKLLCVFPSVRAGAALDCRSPRQAVRTRRLLPRLTFDPILLLLLLPGCESTPRAVCPACLSISHSSGDDGD